MLTLNRELLPSLEMLTTDLERDEAYRQFVYDDATGLPIKPGTFVKGHPTVGVGFCLDIVGLEPNEIAFILKNREEEIIHLIGTFLPWAGEMAEPRQRVLVEMAFNMGVHNLMAFHDTLAHLQREEYTLASASLLQSDAAKKAPTRYKRLANMLLTGQDVH